jgi:hypothetical protein
MAKPGRAVAKVVQSQQPGVTVVLSSDQRLTLAILQLSFGVVKPKCHLRLQPTLAPPSCSASYLKVCSTPAHVCGPGSARRRVRAGVEQT